jgi:hypothetical protein
MVALLAAVAYDIKLHHDTRETVVALASKEEKLTTPPYVALSCPGEIGFSVSVGRKLEDKVVWTTVSPAGIERQTFLGLNEYSQVFTLPKCDVLQITLVRRNPAAESGTR